MYIETVAVANELGKNDFSEFTEIEQAFLTRTINAVEAMLTKHYVDLTGAATKTEYLPHTNRDDVGDYDLVDIDHQGGRIVARPGGSGYDAIVLSSTPVLLEGLQVWEDPNAQGGQASGAFGASTLLTLGTDYYLDVNETGKSRSGILRRRNGIWCSEARSIKITYKTGTLALSAGDLALVDEVILKSVAHNYRFWKSTFNVNKDGSPIQSETIGKYSYTVGNGNREGAYGNAFGGFGPLIPDEIAATISHLFNWGNLI